MQHPNLLAFGLLSLVLGFLLRRWSGRYDAADIATDAAWRMVRRRSTDGAREELGRVIEEQLGEVRADVARSGIARAAIKHGGRLVLARFAAVCGLVLMLLGGAAGVAAFLRR